ncbi:MAG: hypothetical protein LBH38_00585 [Holosporales bacterium]|nr:hypothetical protein [Holosporales bacterium]
MLEDASFWVFLSFLTFFVLFGKKLYSIAVGMVDKYREDIADQFKEAEALKAEAQDIQKRLTARTAQVQQDIATLKEETKHNLEARKRAHTISIEDMARIAEKNHAEQLAALEASIKTHIIHTLAEQIILHAQKIYTPAPFSVDAIRWTDVQKALETRDI